MLCRQKPSISTKYETSQYPSWLGARATFEQSHRGSVSLAIALGSQSARNSSLSHRHRGGITLMQYAQRPPLARGHRCLCNKHKLRLWRQHTHGCAAAAALPPVATGTCTAACAMCRTDPDKMQGCMDGAWLIDSCPSAAPCRRALCRQRTRVPAAGRARWQRMRTCCLGVSVGGNAGSLCGRFGGRAKKNASESPCDFARVILA